jgi:hypothetical protein
VHFTCDRAAFVASATSDNLSQGERFYLGAVVLWRCLSPPDKLAALYLTTIGVFSADAIGAIENTSQVFQPDDRF